MNFVEELRWRGMLHDMMPGTEELLAKEQVTAYIGFDPTADSLHIGHLCSVMILRHFQRCGHKPLALIGGATGMIGDPSGKSAERNLLTEETLQHNMDGMLKAVINSHTGRIVGCTLLCIDAPEVINTVALAMKTGQHYSFLRDFIFTHPSMNEGLNELFNSF